MEGQWKRRRSWRGKEEEGLQWGGEVEEEVERQRTEGKGGRWKRGSS